MPYSYDKTLLAKLGFQDSDKKNSLHDKGCRYLAQSEIATALVKSVISGTQLEGKEVTIRDTRCEVSIGKGSGQYKTTIGFIDVVIRTNIGNSDFNFCVEVKIGQESMGNCLRQINLYKSYTDGFEYRYEYGTMIWILASPWAIDEQQKSMLDSSAIFHIRLGSKFKEFCLQNPKLSESTEL